MPAWPRTANEPTTRQSGKISTTVNRTRRACRSLNARSIERRASGPCQTRAGWELRRPVTSVAASLGSDAEGVNRLADAEPGVAVPFPPDGNEPAFCIDGRTAPRLVDVEAGDVGEVVVIFGKVVLT